MSLKQAAQDILDLLERGVYSADGVEVSIAAAQQNSVDSGRLYSPAQLSTLRDRTSGAATSINVVEGTTQTVAQTMAKTGSLALLNFASARNPGGGFLNGAKAQEEDICRCSGLYPGLLPHAEYYDVNRRQDSLLYTDYAIFNPEVPFFKIRGTGDFLAQPFLASVITAPAPNSGPYLRQHPGDFPSLEEAFERRWQNVLCIARDQHVSRLLLGAWGCGAFGGDPEMAARTAKRALREYGSPFSEVVFAIPGKGKQSSRNLKVFREVLGA